MLADEEIRAICLRVCLAENQDHFRAALTELKICLRDSIVKAENLAVRMLLEKSQRKTA